MYIEPMFGLDIHGNFYAVQRWGLRCRWELSQICDSERAFKISIYSKVSLDVLPLWSRFWEFWANHLKLRLQLNHAPVNETYSAKVRNITTTSKTPSLTRIVCVQGLNYSTQLPVG